MAKLYATYTADNPMDGSDTILFTSLDAARQETG